MNTRLFFSFMLILSGALVTPDCRGALLYSKAPNGGEQTVREGLGTLSQSMSRYLEGIQPKDLTIGKPWREYSVEPADLVSGQLLSAAHAGPWRYPLMHGTNVVATAGVIAGQTNGQALTFAGLDTGSHSRETAEALRMAGQLPQVAKTDYELRGLTCPPILFSALWLHGKTNDIIIPLSPGREQWKPCQPYSESEMIRRLKPAAAKRLNAPD